MVSWEGVEGRKQRKLWATFHWYVHSVMKGVSKHHMGPLTTQHNAHQGCKKSSEVMTFLKISIFMRVMTGGEQQLIKTTNMPVRLSLHLYNYSPPHTHTHWSRHLICCKLTSKISLADVSWNHELIVYNYCYIYTNYLIVKQTGCNPRRCSIVSVWNGHQTCLKQA